jgi:hypothetical protein
MRKKIVVSLATLMVMGILSGNGLIQGAASPTSEVLDTVVVTPEPTGSGAPNSKDVWGTVSPPPGLAQSYGEDVGGGLVKFVNLGLAFLTGLAAIWFLITIILSGIKIIQSAKSPEDFYTHMKKIMWAAGGMVLVALAYVITTWVLTKLFGDASFIEDPVSKLQTQSGASASPTTQSGTQ